jgi:hypothetical protein
MVGVRRFSIALDLGALSLVASLSLTLVAWSLGRCGDYGAGSIITMQIGNGST